MDTTPASQTMTLDEIHHDAVQYFAAVRRALRRMRSHLDDPLPTPADERLRDECIAALEARYETARIEMHDAAANLRDARPECCQRWAPVPHRCGHAAHRNHCTADTCW